MASAGEILRSARQQRNLTVEEVSQRTKIRPKIIDAMERDDFAALPATYMQAFIRTYAQFLDVQDLPDLPSGMSVSKLSAPATVPGAAPSAPLTASRDMGATNNTMTSYNFSSRQAKTTTEQALKWIYSAVAVLVCSAVYVWLYGNPFAEPQDDQPAMQQLQVTNELPAGSALIITEKLNAASAALSPTIAAGDSLILEARALDNAWISVVMDKRRSEQQMLEAGKTYRWAAEKLITFSLGNAGGVQFMRNGVPIEMLGKPGAVVRDVRVTREGITASSIPILAKRLESVPSAETATELKPVSPVQSSALPATTKPYATVQENSGERLATTPSSSTPFAPTNAAALDAIGANASNNTPKKLSDTTKAMRPRPKVAKQAVKLIEPVVRDLTPPDVKTTMIPPKPKLTQQVPTLEKRSN